MEMRINVRYIPNIISLLRIPMSLGLLLVVHRSLFFVLLYLLCGISDLLDGYLARKMHIESALGARLDSIADLMMYIIILLVVCLWDFESILGFIPFLAFIAFIRSINVGIGYYKFHQLVCIHTIGNKVMGLLVFFVPLIYLIVDSFSFLWFLLPLSLIISLEETWLIGKMKELDLNRKGLFFRKEKR